MIHVPAHSAGTLERSGEPGSGSPRRHGESGAPWPKNGSLASPKRASARGRRALRAPVHWRCSAMRASPPARSSARSLRRGRYGHRRRAPATRTVRDRAGSDPARRVAPGRARRPRARSAASRRRASARHRSAHRPPACGGCCEPADRGAAPRRRMPPRAGCRRMPRCARPRRAPAVARRHRSAPRWRHAVASAVRPARRRRRHRQCRVQQARRAGDPSRRCPAHARCRRRAMTGPRPTRRWLAR